MGKTREVCEDIRDTSEKQNLMFGTETFVCNSRLQPFPVVLVEVCTHCSRDSGPLLHTDLLQILQVSGLSLGKTDSAPSKDFRLDMCWLELGGPCLRCRILIHGGVVCY
ncbi:hypothetical protein ILYODFUR_036486 [Ilyodon furcidens]|uniref:Uncharacterized protein n=1 Tax=Ilyodon furcidens TaxID=33524 RepID=A0ABV0THZ3_9TELE